ncbi:stage IV sporulation protein A, partial [Klebsiella pneumoniae subsp. pneumoniae]|nr:stage IV sporulation protein A [Klebsiella pneumoniae subsp. pneumoniae]
AAALASAGEALTAAGVTFTAITRDTNIIAQVVAGNSAVLGCFSAEQIATITEFGQHMNFLGIDLTRIPQIGLSLDIVLPLLSVITMFLSTHISMKASGQQMQG